MRVCGGILFSTLAFWPRTGCLWRKVDAFCWDHALGHLFFMGWDGEYLYTGEWGQHRQVLGEGRAPLKLRASVCFLLFCSIYPVLVLHTGLGTLLS